MPSVELAREYRLQREHGGWATPPGPVACALERARAVLRAEDLGLVFIREDEREAWGAVWDGEGPAPKYLLWVAVYSPDDITAYGVPRCGARPYASLGMVGVNDLYDPYLRTVEGDLAIEALAELDRLNGLDEFNRTG